MQCQVMSCITTDATTNKPAPTAATGRQPNLATAPPDTNEGAYIPSMCDRITCDTSWKESPRSRIARGVGDIRNDMAPYESAAIATAATNPKRAKDAATATEGAFFGSAFFFSVLSPLPSVLFPQGSSDPPGAFSPPAASWPPSAGKVTSPGTDTIHSSRKNATPVHTYTPANGASANMFFAAAAYSGSRLGFHP